MPFHRLTDDERRSLCRTTLESLEMWLRRLIDEQLTVAYGPDYIESKDEHGQNLIKGDIRKDLAKRLTTEPGRYPRRIDAALLDTEIDIICNPQLYNKHFEEPLRGAFPIGREQARAVLTRLLDPRNALSHANPVSVRKCEQVVCYSNDVIDSLKAYYAQKNMTSEYNVPTILVVKDSFGVQVHRPQMMLVGGTWTHVDFKQPDQFLRPGDTLSLEVEIDPSFPSSDYQVEWRWQIETLQPTLDNPMRLVLPIEEKHVGETLGIECRVITNRVWHRHGPYDDSIYLVYKVLPPIE